MRYRKGTSEDRKRWFFPRRPQFPIFFHQIVELRMCALSNRIREKPNWWEKMKDEAIMERWREEALQQARGDERREWKLTPGMVNLSHRVLGPVLSS